MNDWTIQDAAPAQRQEISLGINLLEIPAVDSPRSAVKGEEIPSAVLDWLRLAAHPATVRRALMTALIVGFVLISINHGSAIIAGEMTRARFFQMCLTVLVPYIVSTTSSVATRREAR